MADQIDALEQEISLKDQRIDRLNKEIGRLEKELLALKPAKPDGTHLAAVSSKLDDILAPGLDEVSDAEIFGDYYDQGGAHDGK